MVDLLPVTGCHLEMCAMWLSLSLSLSWRMTPPAHWGFTGHAIPVSQLTRLTGDMTSETHRLHLQVGLSCVFCEGAKMRESVCVSHSFCNYKRAMDLCFRNLHTERYCVSFKPVWRLSEGSRLSVLIEVKCVLIMIWRILCSKIHHRWHKCIFAIKCPCWWSNLTWFVATGQDKMYRFFNNKKIHHKHNFLTHCLINPKKKQSRTHMHLILYDYV